MTSEELAAIRARVEIADRDDSYLRSYTGASNADLYRHPQVRADMRALLAEVERLSAMVPRWVPRQMTEEATVWTLRCGSALVAGSGVSTLAGVHTVMETHTALVHRDLPTACAVVCARLGLHGIKPPENT